MGIRRTLKWLSLTGLGLFCTLLLGVYLWSNHWPKHDLADLREADAIVCLAAGLAGDGSLGNFSSGRVETCVKLYHAGKAPVLALTGGNSWKNAPPTGQQMAEMAVALGVPRSAVIFEDASESTLQNALFTLPLLPRTERLIVVTDPLHLPRSWASFRWAGAREVALWPSTGAPTRRIILRETLAIGFNALRAPVYSLASVIGVKETLRTGIIH